MIGTVNCVYETPCGWCSKWDKECDKKITKQNNSSIEDDINKSKAEAILACKSESDHEWECHGISTVGTTYICKKCGTHMVYPLEFPSSITISNI